MKSKNYLVTILVLLIQYRAGAQTLVSGYTNLETMVGESGQAIASIKLNTPKGTFIQPYLSVIYNSHTGNSICGSGISIDGISQAITRIPATYEQDGFSLSNINDPFSGRYALNGERIMATWNYSNTNSSFEWDSYLYNAPFSSDRGGGFRTEQETFAKIWVYASGKGYQLGDPSFYADSFRVYTKDGQILDFGCTSDSRIEKPGSTLIISWLLNRISDRNGNFLTIKYIKNAVNAEYYPSEIAYTGNTAKNILPYAKIVFRYDSRPDSIAKYTNGYIVKNTKRLKEISAYDHDHLYRKYLFAYASDTSNSKLVKLTELGTDSASALKPVLFTWKSQPAVPGFYKTGSGQWSGNAATPANIIPGDFNGDGKQDLAGYTGSNGLFHISLSTGAGFSNSFWQATVSSGITKLAGDFNGDGKSDLAGYSGGKWQISISTGKNFMNSDWSGSYTGPAFIKEYVVDLNADGRNDLLCYSGGGNWHTYTSQGTSFVHSTYNDGCTTCNGTVLIGDFDGDGRSDVINAAFLATINNASINNCFVSDLNRDGLSDICGFIGNSQWKVNLSKGTSQGYSFVTAIWSAHNNGIVNNTVGDVNKDGFTDMITYSGGATWTVYLGTGKGFKNAGVWSGHAGGMANNITGDYDGDGATELAGYTAINGLWHVTLSNMENELVSDIQNGNGVSNSFIYAPLTSTATYQKDSTGTYPNMDFCSPLYVVRSLKTDDGAGNYRTVDYKYANAKFNSRGRGFRGFEKLMVTDSTANAISTTWFNTDFKCISVRPVKTELRTISNVLLHKSENTVTTKKTFFSKDSVYFSYYSKIVDSSFDTNGSFFSGKITNYTYDEFGNVTQTNETYNNGYTITTNNTYSNETSNWLLGRLTASTVSKQMPGKAASVKNSAFAYNSKGILVQEILLPSHPTLRLQNDYTLDEFGNRIAVSISGPGISSRTSYSKYDTDGRLLLESKNALNQVTRSTYKLSLQDSLINPDYLVTTIFRDAFGRELLIKNPDGTSKSTSYIDCTNGTGSCPPEHRTLLKSINQGKQLNSPILISLTE